MIQLFSVNAGYFKLDGGAMHGVVPKSMWQKVNPATDDNMCSWAMRCLLVKHEERLILIDCGMGNKQDEKFMGHFMPHGDDSIEKSLAVHGYTPEHITDVLLTHLHFDHCGGAIKRENGALVPAFANARYWSNAQHWASALNPNPREKASFLPENILPIQESGRLNWITTPHGEEWLPGIRIFYCYGHTEALMTPLITANGRHYLFCADLIPSVAHVSLPWVMAYDMQPMHTLKEKETMLHRAAAEDWVLYMEHDPKIACCTIHQTDKGIKVKETFAL